MDIGAAEAFETNLKNMNKGVLDILLRDETTNRNIIFATDAYSPLGFHDTEEIYREKIMKGGRCIIHPRFKKTAEEQAKRTKAKAEVFTQTWTCCQMINYADDEWFGRKNIFIFLAINMYKNIRSRRFLLIFFYEHNDKNITLPVRNLIPNDDIVIEESYASMKTENH